MSENCWKSKELMMVVSRATMAGHARHPISGSILAARFDMPLEIINMNYKET